MRSSKHGLLSRAVLAFVSAAALSQFVTPRVAFAQDEGAALVEASRCYMCHTLDQPLLGPPYVAIAARHAPRSDVMIEVLARRIVDGGGGNWGVVPMVPNQWVTLDEARVMADWILSLAPE